MTSYRLRDLAICTAALLVAGAGSASAVITDAPAPAKPSKIKVETFAQGLDHPWGMQFLPDGRLLVTERLGRMRLISKDGKLSPADPRRAAGGGRRRSGRPARRSAGARLRHEPHHLSFVWRAARRRQERHQRRARQARVRRRRRTARGCEGHLPAAAGCRQRPPFRLASRLGEGRHAVHHDRASATCCAPRRRTPPTTSARSSASTPTARSPPTTRSRTAGHRRSGRSAIATCRARRCGPRPGTL